MKTAALQGGRSAPSIRAVYQAQVWPPSKRGQHRFGLSRSPTPHVVRGALRRPLSTLGDGFRSTGSCDQMSDENLYEFLNRRERELTHQIAGLKGQLEQVRGQLVQREHE